VLLEHDVGVKCDEQWTVSWHSLDNLGSERGSVISMDFQALCTRALCYAI